MNSRDFESLIITIFVLVDDWYQIEVKALKTLSPAAKAQMSDSPKGYRFAYEIMTLALVIDYLSFPGETQFIGFVRANDGPWVPNLLSQSQLNRRWRRLGQMLETLGRNWVQQLAGENADSFVIDTKPIPVMGYRTSKGHSDFSGSASYGYGAIALLKYFGYKLVMLCILKGLPVADELVSANTDKGKSVEVV